MDYTKIKCISKCPPCLIFLPMAQPSYRLWFPPFTSCTTSFPCVGVQLCSSRHFELYRSVGDCLYAAIILAGLATETMTLASVHGFDAVNTLRHSMTSSSASEKERIPNANQEEHTCTRAQKGHLKTGHTLLREQRTLKKQELPNRSPELAGTKTQLSLGREKNRVYAHVCGRPGCSWALTTLLSTSGTSSLS